METLRYSTEQHREYLRMIEVLRLSWKHIFPKNPKYNTAMFRNFVLSMWDSEKITLADACTLLADIKSVNTQREYIYRLYDDDILNCDVYIGTDKQKRTDVESYGRGKTSPQIWLSTEARNRVSQFLDEAINEIGKSFEAISVNARRSAANAGSVRSQSEPLPDAIAPSLKRRRSVAIGN